MRWQFTSQHNAQTFTDTMQMTWHPDNICFLLPRFLPNTFITCLNCPYVLCKLYAFEVIREYY